MVKQLRILSKRFAVVGLASSLLVGCLEDDFAENISSENKLLTEGKKVIITFHSNGATGSMQSMEVPAGAFLTLPANTFTKSGEIFEGWSLTEYQIVTYLDAGVLNVADKNIDLYAVWREAEEYQVIFNANGGAGAMNTMYIIEGTKVTLPASLLSRSGYYFNGWSAIANGTLKYADSQELTMPRANLELFAVWGEIPVYSINFQNNGGTGSMDPVFAQENSDVNLPNNSFSRTGYSFQGWSYADNTAIELSDSATVENLAANTTLYANWQPNQYDITFNSNGGSGSMTSIQYNYDATVALPANTFSKPGYDFLGWAETSGGSVVYSNSQSFSANKTGMQLYAIWGARMHQIIFNANGGTGSMANQSIQEGQTVNLNANSFTRDNHYLMGWSESSSASVGDYGDRASYTMGTENKTLYAIWGSYQLSRMAAANWSPMGGGHSLFIDRHKNLWSIGRNSSGQLGNGSYSDSQTLLKIDESIISVSAGASFSLYLKSDGSLWGMGDDSAGQLGVSGASKFATPTEILSSDVVSIEAGYNYSLFIKSDGSLWGMGDSDECQLGSGGDSFIPREILPTNVKMVAAGYSHALVLKKDGSLWGMGTNLDGELGIGTSTTGECLQEIISSDVSFIAAGYKVSTFVKSDGSLWGMGYRSGVIPSCTGCISYAKLPEKIVEEGVLTSALGAYHMKYLKTDGSLWKLTLNNIEPDSVVAIEAASKATFFMKSTDEIYGLGENSWLPASAKNTPYKVDFGSH